MRKCVICPRGFWPSRNTQKTCSLECSHKNRRNHENTWRAKHRRRVNSKQRKWYHDNIEERRAYARAWYAKNAERLRPLAAARARISD